MNFPHFIEHASVMVVLYDAFEIKIKRGYVTVLAHLF
jgi:hypothetical protein